ncbi:AhpC/TSA family protein [Parasphingorhabdus flavimaris]|jgi:peroxiredoxin|uniref:AhpC/TSA family protein n=1 Tax=Parasphingorhabdus flavimaris TaxID=266812 RepID=A0ABX2N2E5_9SPHN|nr:peroxiredoxin-like family protein [Parasphingorhabdus flavimaris]NVD27843.1 AhpC/TSA family protein [Parasphingorhabdus flavimaris]|tara:strand:- start:15238 stop:15768 length:531 start_codon:yes stop_codon:yes gene_type:complete
MPNILPTQAVPDFSVPLIGGGTFELSEQLGDNFTLLVFYRGVHCPICKMQLRELQRKLGDFEKRGINVVAISMDSQERARKSSDEWDIKDVTLGYGLSEEQARAFDLYISSGRPDSEEPEVFSEPALLLVKPDQSLYFASIQSMPFTRPPLDELLKGIDYALENDYPARGELAQSR